jgi:hypothetical protein
MLEIKLNAHIVAGQIQISEEQKKELAKLEDGSSVEVIVRAEESNFQQTSQKRDILQEMEDRGYDSIIEYLMDYPLQVENVQRLTRDEIYSGKRFR